jgi:hypothetical protein
MIINWITSWSALRKGVRRKCSVQKKENWSVPKLYPHIRWKRYLEMIIACFLVLLILPLLIFTLVHNVSPDEISGVIIHNSSLFFVGDKSPNHFFQWQGWRGRSGYFQLPSLTPHKIESTNAKDLEAIDIFDGEPVVLSEASSKLFSAKGIVVDYSEIATELSRNYSNNHHINFNNGFEGLSIRPADDDSQDSQIAALWEGGFSQDIQNFNGKVELFNVVIVQHRLSPRKTTFIATKNKCKFLTLDWKELGKKMGLVDEKGKYTISPRGPDLVWYPYKEGDEDRWGYIVLMSCSHPKYLHRIWLCRITGCLEDGGNFKLCIVEITDKLKKHKDLNWEGLCWYDKDYKQLLMVADEGKSLQFFVLDKPQNW